MPPASLAPDAAVPDAGHADAGPTAWFEQLYAAPSLWAQPIEDYLAAGRDHVGPQGTFNEALQDLVVFEDRLYIGYGDATENLGRIIPIQIRSFASPTSTIATSEFDTDEEQIDRYRSIGDALYIAGIDATEDAFLGNMYIRRPAEGWLKRRTIMGGVHVHDVAQFDGTLFAVGSGADGPREWNAGRIFGYLWRSSDDGDSFETAHREPNGGVGDSRFTRLLPVGELLWMFGYQTDRNARIDRVPNSNYNGLSVARLEARYGLSGALITETDVISGTLGLARGVDVSRNPIRARAWTIDHNAEVRALDALDDKTIIDVYVTPQAVLLLVIDGSSWPPNRDPWRATVLVTSDFLTFDELVSFEWPHAVRAVAHWQGALYFGTDRGQVLRATPQ